MTRALNSRLAKLEGPPIAADGWRRCRFAVVRGSIAEAEQMPAKFKLVSDQEHPVIVTEWGWEGGEPELLSPLCGLDEATDDGLRVMSMMRVRGDRVELPPSSVLVSTIVGDR